MSTTLTFQPANTYAGYSTSTAWGTIHSRMQAGTTSTSAGSGFVAYSGSITWTGTNLASGTYTSVIRSIFFNKSTTNIPLSLLVGKVSTGTLSMTIGSTSYSPNLYYGPKTNTTTNNWQYTYSTSSQTINNSTYSFSVSIPSTLAYVLGGFNKVTHANITNISLSVVAPAYTITYNANNGSGAPSAQTIEISANGWKATLSSTKPTRSGYTFLGWSTSSTATSASYSAGGSITISANTVLYAVWKVSSVLHIVNGSSLNNYMVYVVEGGKLVLYRVCVVENGALKNTV